MNLIELNTYFFFLFPCFVWINFEDDDVGADDDVYDYGADNDNNKTNDDDDDGFLWSS